MASLANQTISSTYDGLIKTSTDQPVGVSGVQLLEDGVGNTLALSVGRANQGVTVTGTLTATSLSGTIAAASVLADGVTATTQSLGDNSTKVATTAYVDAQVTASDLDFAGDSGTGAVDLDSQSLTIAGTANEIETSASGQTITIGLPSSVTVGTLTATNLGGTLSTAAQTNITSVGTLSSLAVSGELKTTQGTDNTIIGAAAGNLATTTGVRNVSVGDTSLFAITSGNDNVAIGQQSLNQATSGSSNVAVGRRSLVNVTTGSKNIGIGFTAGDSITTGSNNTIIGDIAGTGGLSDTIILAAGTAERMRIDSSGSVLIGKTTANDTSVGFHFSFADYLSITRDAGATLYLNRLTSDGAIVEFARQNSIVGSISVTASATAYNTSSDYRLKENVVPMEGALDRVDALKPSRFNFIADPSTTVDGFLAHEVAEVIPEAITGEKDAVDEEGNPIYQGIDQSKLVPLLVGAIKELRAEIELLKNK